MKSGTSSSSGQCSTPSMMYSALKDGSSVEEDHLRGYQLLLHQRDEVWQEVGGPGGDVADQLQ
eukprot:2554882-Heterocapsa_arctica.AAC.1